MVGLGIVVEAWQGMRLDGIGLLLAAGPAACCAGYFLLSDSFGPEVDPLGLIAWGLAGAAVALAPLARPWTIVAARRDRHARRQHASRPGRVPLADVVATVLAYITGVHAVRRLSAAVGATVASLEVIAGAVIAWVLLGEALGPFQIVGGLIVITGAILAQRATALAPPAPGVVRESEPIGVA